MIANTKKAPKAARRAPKAKAPKPVTKKDRLIRVLSARAGAEIGSISEQLGWQAHTTRAALSGLRKAGFELAAEKPGEGMPTRYRITARPGDDAASLTLTEVTDAG